MIDCPVCGRYTCWCSDYQLREYQRDHEHHYNPRESTRARWEREDEERRVDDELRARRVRDERLEEERREEERRSRAAAQERERQAQADYEYMMEEQARLEQEAQPEGE